MTITRSCVLTLCLVCTGLFLGEAISAADWARFRGPNGSGVSLDDAAVPAKWDANTNLKWKTALPGPGLSSPIVVGDRVFVTCWSGYGVDRRDPGDQQNLRRHLVCLDRKTGNELWNKTIEPVLPEDEYRGMFAENGYASHTPVSDGERVYVFFGKSGLYAFDLDGNQLWQKSVGTESDPMGWGSASSPILYEDLVIVTAAAESESLVAFNKITGEQEWKQEAGYLTGTWGTPALVNVDGDRQDLVIAIPGEVWALNPATGKLRWYCQGIDSNSMCASVITHDGIVYVVGGRNGGTLAVRAGGKGDVTRSHTLWTENDSGRISTPLYVNGRIYWVSRKTLNCIDAESGERQYRMRLTGGSTPAATPPTENRRGGRRGRGRGRGSDYSSPVVADGKLYYVTRAGECYVLELGDKAKQLAVNRFGPDSGEFSASPAISDGELFVRSSKFLFCVADDK